MKNYSNQQKDYTNLLQAYTWLYTIFVMLDKKRNMSNIKVDIYDVMFGNVQPEDLGTICKADFIDEALSFPANGVIHNTTIAPLHWDKDAHKILKDKTIDMLKTDKGWQDLMINGVDYTGEQNFKESNIIEGAIVHCKFNDADFTKADFSRANLAEIKFTNCIFNETIFDRTNACAVVFENCTFNNIKFNRVRFEEIFFDNCKLIDCDFVGNIIKQSDSVDSVIQDCYFDNEYWNDINFNTVSFTSNNFTKCDLTQIRFIECKLTDNTLNKLCFNHSRIEHSELSKNAWLMVGFDKSNMLDHVVMNQEHMQRCNFKYA